MSAWQDVCCCAVCCSAAVSTSTFMSFAILCSRSVWLSLSYSRSLLLLLLLI